MGKGVRIMPLLLLLLSLLVYSTAAADEVCLQPRIDFVNNDRGAGASSYNSGWNGFVQIVGDNAVARNRQGIFKLQPTVRSIGDAFGYDFEWIALAGNVVAVNARGYVSVLKRHDNDTLTLAQVVARSADDSAAKRLNPA